MSGRTGIERCALPVFQEERHIVSCVALGQWLYAVAAGDREWLLGPGLRVIRGCAEYWAGRAVFDPEDGAWHIRGVCGPDEHAGIVDDNATTNQGAAWTLRTAAALLGEAGEQPPPEWERIAGSLPVLWDEERGIPLQMAGWSDDRVIKQADTTLLIHPWHYPMDSPTMQRTVDYYRAHYEANPIMMGAAMDGIVDCKLGRESEVLSTLENLTAYFRGPFLAATESPTNERLVFLTGMGGLLQLLVMGIAGLITDELEGLRAESPCLPPAIGGMVLHGVHHGGEPHRITVVREPDGRTSAHIEKETRGRARG